MAKANGLTSGLTVKVLATLAKGYTASNGLRVRVAGFSYNSAPNPTYLASYLVAKAYPLGLVNTAKDLAFIRKVATRLVAKGSR